MAETPETTVRLSFEDRKALSKIDESLAASSEVDTSELQKLTTDQMKSLKETLPKESQLLAKLNHLEAVIQSKGSQSKSDSQSYDEGEVGGKDKPASATQASNPKEDQEIKDLREKIAKLESGKSQEEAKKALERKVEDMRADGYTDLYILSRLMANGVFSTTPLAIESKIIKSAFGWNIIPVYNAMAGLTKKSIEWNGIGKDALIEKLGTEEKYAKMLREMIQGTHNHLQGTVLNTEIERLKGIDTTIATLEGIRTELEKDPIDHKKVSAEFEKYLRMSGQYLRLDDAARAGIKTDLEAKNKTLSQTVTAAQNAEQIAKKELDDMHAHNKQIETDVRAKERELANLKNGLDPTETKFMNKWKSEAVLTLTSTSDWSFKDDTQKQALIADAKADPGKYIPNPESHPNIQALHADYENKKAPYDIKQQEIGTLKNTIYTPDDITVKQDAYEDAKKKHTEIKAEHTQKSPKYNSLLAILRDIDLATDPAKKALLQAEFNKEYATVNPTRMTTGSSVAEIAKNEEMNKIKKGDPTRTGSTTVQSSERIAAVDRALAEEKAKKKPIDTTRSSLSLTEKADAERMKAYVDGIHDKIQQVNKLAQEKVAALSIDPKIQSGDEFYKEANKILNETNSLVEKYNKDVMDKYGDATHKLTPLQKADFDKMLVSSVKAEKLMAANAWFDKKIMDRTITKGYFGGLMVFAIGSSAYQVGKGIANNDARAVGEGVVNIVDTGVGFIPVFGGVYDLGTSAIFTVKGLAQGKGRATDWNGREMAWTELGTRVGFGVLGLIPYVGTAAKAAKAAKLADGSIDAVKATKDVQKIDQTIEVSQLAMKAGATAMVVEASMSVVWSTGKWGYALATQDQPVSITGSVMNTARSVVGK